MILMSELLGGVKNLKLNGGDYTDVQNSGITNIEVRGNREDNKEFMCKAMKHLNQNFVNNLEVVIVGKEMFFDIEPLDIIKKTYTEVSFSEKKCIETLKEAIMQRDSNKKLVIVFSNVDEDVHEYEDIKRVLHTLSKLGSSKYSNLTIVEMMNEYSKSRIIPKEFKSHLFTAMPQGMFHVLGFYDNINRVYIY